MKTNDRYAELSCEFLNQAFYEEVLEEEGLDINEIEGVHFDEDEIE